MYSVLEPVELCGIKLRNRFVRSATWDGTAPESGDIPEGSFKMYEDLASGELGLIFTAYMFVSTRGRANEGQYGIHSDEMLPGLRRLVDTAHRHGAAIAVQIAHGGRRSPFFANRGITALAPSRIGDNPPHRAMTDEEVEGTLDDFAAAAVRAGEAGFDAVQLHGAHGYLVSQFFSPLNNRREDRWGGSSENRRRFHVEMVRRVRKAVGPNYPVMMKFGLMDPDDGGATLDEGIAALKAMVDAGLDAVEISVGIGSGSKSSIRVTNGGPEDVYLRDLAAAAKRAVDIPVMLVGGLRSLETAEEIVRSGDADFLALSRPLIREPGLIGRWASGDRSPARCISCNKCLTHAYKLEGLKCIEEEEGS